jgi:hypothetical protein
VAVGFEGDAGPVVSPGVPGPAFLSGSGDFMAMWKKVAIVAVAWIASVLVYVEFFKSR